MLRGVDSTNFTYASGLRSSVTDPQENETTLAHDSEGNRTSITDPLKPSGCGPFLPSGGGYPQG